MLKIPPEAGERGMGERFWSVKPRQGGIYDFSLTKNGLGLLIDIWSA